ncbi:MAG: DUF1294 domain-containing protein [Bacteroidales bacterium]|nr:DUF1294 domain-containing protein [Bacteroidales bacterium]
MSDQLQPIIVIYFVVINVVTFIVYGIDKWKARHDQWRIPEAILLGLAFIGGSIGACMGMHVWHHKTLRKRFQYGVPLILLIQIALILFVSCRCRQVAELPVSADAHRYEPEHSADVFLLMYDKEVGKQPLLKAIEQYHCAIVYDYHTINGMALKKPADKTLEETMQFFRQVKGVLSVEYDHIYRLDDPVVRTVTE